VELFKKGLGTPIGSVTQMQRIRLGKRYEKRNPLIKDFVPLAKLQDLVFGGWDIFEDDMFVAATKAGVLPADMLRPVQKELSAIRPIPGVFDSAYIKNLTPKRVKGKTKMELAEALIADILNFRKENKLDRTVMVWCGSTEAYTTPIAVHQTLEAFEEGLRNNSPEIAPSMIYCYAALKTGTPYANGAPNLSADVPAPLELAEKLGVPVAGKDFKTGQGSRAEPLNGAGRKSPGRRKGPRGFLCLLG
jgi:myo-inositol-1-phosphate synthase